MARADRFVHAMPSCMADDPAMMHARQPGSVAMRRRCQEAPTQIDDTKPPQKVRQATVECAGVTVAHFGGDITLLLCQEHSRTFSGRCYEDPMAMKQRRPSFSPDTAISNMKSAALKHLQPFTLLLAAHLSWHSATCLVKNSERCR